MRWLLKTVREDASWLTVTNISWDKSSRAYCSRKKIRRKNSLPLRADQWADRIDLLIDNIFVTFGGLTFRQVIGIPMGTDCAPLLANLYLHCDEYQFMTCSMKSDVKLAKVFNQIALNCDFDLFKYKIYQDSLIVNRENHDPSDAHYLVAQIDIIVCHVNTSIYDLPDDSRSI